MCHVPCTVRYRTIAVYCRQVALTLIIAVACVGCQQNATKNNGSSVGAFLDRRPNHLRRLAFLLKFPP